MTPSPTATPVPTGCRSDSCTAAGTYGEITSALGVAFFRGESIEVDLTGSITLSAPLEISNGAVVTFKSSNGMGELDGGGAGRVMEVEGVGTRVVVDGVTVRDGNAGTCAYYCHGGCMHVDNGAKLELDGAKVFGCSAVVSRHL